MAPIALLQIRDFLDNHAGLDQGPRSIFLQITILFANPEQLRAGVDLALSH